MLVVLLADFPVHRLPGFEGGPTGHSATWLPIIAEALEPYATDFEFHWITCTKAVTDARDVSAWGQRFHLLPRRKLSLEILTAFQRERRIIAKVLDGLRPNFVHAWGTEQGYAHAASGFKGPSLLSMQGILTAYCHSAEMPLLARIQAFHERRVLRQVRHLTVESPWGRERLKQLAPQAFIDLVEYGVDPACFEIRRELSSQADPSSSSQHFSVSASKHLPPRPLALTVGTLSRLKGTDTLLKAFTDPLLAHIDLVVLGGVPPEFASMQLPPNIRLLGHVSQSEVRNWMAKAWCLVHPTRADTSPNCVKEARVIGLPVVTTPAGGQTQYVEHGKSGFLHDPGDGNGLIDGVLAVTSDRETNLRIGATGQAECRESLKPETTATRLIEIYQSLLR